MQRRRWLGFSVIGVVLLAVVVPGLLSTTSDDYRATAVTSARDAASAALTASTAGRASVDDRMISTYTSAVLTDARGGVATAIDDLVGLDVPDRSAQGVRDEVLPLLVRAASLIGDVTEAADRDDHQALSTAAKELGAVGARLREFAGSHR
ncbi:hypothetical protein [Umezawaea sp. Da 62-37]|uniref:hypothetical protein n=1 Tax=Umezawaea sp. Da 62-37 TaxID=3075927 RepID=UPI0028F6E084|nr:hypothetical protein [Umezawaea sp. Da 62-37]WNV83022.1 hypothetical protein RM788_33175 [Umezawaea sp. Da 62-37]